MKNRIKELRYVKASTLIPDKRNWRRHPESQTSAVKTMLDRIGWSDAVIARESGADGLVLVDGHLRAGLDPDETVPVLVVDLDEQEAGEVLATLDPLAALAEIDAEALRALVDDIRVEDDADFGGVLSEIEDFAQLRVEELDPDSTDAHYTPLGDVDTNPGGNKFVVPHSAAKDVFPWTLHIPREQFFDVTKRARKLAEHWGIPEDAAATMMKALEIAERHEFHGDTAEDKD